MAFKVNLREDTATQFEITSEYKGGNEAYVQGFGQIKFSRLTPAAAAELVSQKFPYLRAKEKKEAPVAKVEKAEK